MSYILVYNKLTSYLNVIKSTSHKFSEAWKLINSITGRNSRKKGILAANSPAEGIQIFHNHFKKLLQPNIPTPPPSSIDPVFGHNFTPPTPFNTEPFNDDEIEFTIKQLSNNKATGVDNIPAEVLRNPILLPHLSIFFNHVLLTGLAFSDWKLSLIIPVPKKR